MGAQAGGAAVDLALQADEAAEDDCEEEGDEILPLGKSPMTIGHRKDCDIVLPGFKLFGRLSGEFVQQMGGWCVVPESPFWAPIWLGDDKLDRIKQLVGGEVLVIGGIEFRYSKGEDF